ncbi:sulfatase-like hydrolase/transferase [Lutimonas halocynthiae]|uniref:sulfatase-like hydrolase/transferase n=1 Tax=Lutimonas halocynthiae TaxID=1446477 RepID=UPI0025B47731|nr:sulfatase-like hydrolase/transferase [Lutimonas halocynthiae]MDN3642741.1 sulfatase-like hydrolase/transferase [Lutimonas halocynthiae]
MPFKNNLLSFYIIFIIAGFVLQSCSKSKNKTDVIVISNSLSQDLNSKPNILWIVAEDLSAYIPSFGDSTVVTPNLSKLAQEGVCYDNFYSPHPVCAPARAAIITGMYANSIGASHMRTGPWFGGKPSEEFLINYQKNAMPENIKPYEAVPSAQVKMFTEYLRKEGYYCSNNSKEDYQFLKTPTAWDESGAKAHWRNRHDKQPFFSVFNIGITHEAQIWKKENDSLWVDSNLKVPIPPYLPDTDIAKKDIRRMYSNIKEMDAQVGKILNELKEDGLLENTIIFWYTDHGGPLPRQKRLLYDSGIKVPMIIRFPNPQQSHQRDNRMISFIDLAPTLMSLAKIEPPQYMQGKAFLGEYKRRIEPQYVYGAADRFDETTDHVRSVRDKNFKYIKYYDPEKPMFLEVTYRNQMPIMQELLRLKKEGNLNKDQALWFREKKPNEELFDIQNDPYEIHDLSQDSSYKSILGKMRKACENWTDEINDTGLIPEEALIARLHPHGIQPQTEAIQVQLQNGKIDLYSETEGASIGYKIVKNGINPANLSWTIYSRPITLNSNERLLAIAHRIGYLPSEVLQYNSH